MGTKLDKIGYPGFLVYYVDIRGWNNSKDRDVLVSRRIHNSFGV